MLVNIEQFKTEAKGIWWRKAKDWNFPWFGK
jgi:hypothetical protein